jgi:hypothetical protein
MDILSVIGLAALDPGGVEGLFVLALVLGTFDRPEQRPVHLPEYQPVPGLEQADPLPPEDRPQHVWPLPDPPTLLSQ